MSITLGESANNVLQGFGGVIPNEALSLEDAANAYLHARAFYWQQLGITDTDITVKSADIDLSGGTDDEMLGGYLSEATPAFAEWVENADSAREQFYKVKIVPLDEIRRYQGTRAIAFYGSPTRIKTAGAFGQGMLRIYYDPSSLVKNPTLSTPLPFPPNFQMMVEKRAQKNLCALIGVKETMNAYSQARVPQMAFLNAIAFMQNTLSEEVAQWEQEFRLFRFTENTDEVHHRGNVLEIGEALSAAEDTMSGGNWAGFLNQR